MEKFVAWLSDSRNFLGASIVFATLTFAFMFSYELVPNSQMPFLSLHKNRITGAVCNIQKSCWIFNDLELPR